MTPCGFERKLPTPGRHSVAPGSQHIKGEKKNKGEKEDLRVKKKNFKGSNTD